MNLKRNQMEFMQICDLSKILGWKSNIKKLFRLYLYVPVIKFAPSTFEIIIRDFYSDGSALSSYSAQKLWMVRIIITNFCNNSDDFHELTIEPVLMVPSSYTDSSYTQEHCSMFLFQSLNSYKYSYRIVLSAIYCRILVKIWKSADHSKKIYEKNLPPAL